MITINGRSWRVLEVSPGHSQLERSDGSFSIGACDNNKSSIYIVEGLDNFMFRKVLCHELTHAAMFSYGIEMSLEQEEILADIIATYGREIICKTNIFFSRIKENREVSC